MKVNGISSVVEITTVAQSVAHVKMYPKSENISSKDVNVAGCVYIYDGW